MATSKLINNIVGQSSKYDLSKISLSYTQNMFEETVDANESSTTKILKSIPGVGSNLINTSDRVMEINGVGKVRGIFVTSETAWAGKSIIYVVIGANLYLYYMNQLNLIGNVSNDTNTVHFAECQSNGSFDKYVVIVDGINAFALDIDEPPLQQRNHISQIKLPERFNTTSGEKTIDLTSPASRKVTSCIFLILVLALSYLHFYYGLADNAHGAANYITWLRF